MKAGDRWCEAPAPAVAVVGPANSGKTSLLHLLDAALQLHPSRPSVYVVKGNPDGTGRYLFHAPELRQRLKGRVKGAWCETTVQVVCEWIEACRRHLDLVLVDLGGSHAPGNDAILGRCSHFLVVGRKFDNPSQEREEGIESWVEACRRSHLEPLARLRSVVAGQSSLSPTGGGLEGVFRGDACAPGDATNFELVAGLVDALVTLITPSRSPSYLDLRLGRDWEPQDLVDLGGLASRVKETMEAGRTLVLGGRAPIWGYATALHRALDLNPGAAVTVFDPKVPAGLVPVPDALASSPDPDLARDVGARWRTLNDGEGGALDLRITTPDRFLRLTRPQALRGLPRPQGEPPPGPLVAFGPGPIWLHLAYSRWLRSLPGERAVGHWDARNRSAVLISGPGTPAFVPWPAEEGAVASQGEGLRPGGLSLFIRCGDRYRPPGDGSGWKIVELPAELVPAELPRAVEQVRQALHGHRSARLLIAGPVALGIALGQALAHEPVAIDYLQLNQATKQFELWVSNRRNL